MKYSAKKLAQALAKAISARPDEGKKAMDAFLSLCREKRLLFLLPGVIRHLSRYGREEEESNTLNIRSAGKLSPETAEKIRQAVGFFEGKEEERQDESVIGGFVAEYKNRVFDCSVKNNLHLLKNKLTDNQNEHQ